jgi:hypothetical protein
MISHALKEVKCEGEGGTLALDDQIIPELVGKCKYLEGNCQNCQECQRTMDPGRLTMWGIWVGRIGRRGILIVRQARSGQRDFHDDGVKDSSPSYHSNVFCHGLREFISVYSKKIGTYALLIKFYLSFLMTRP